MVLLSTSIFIIIPWDQISRAAIRGDGFRDFNRYVRYFNNATTSKAELYDWTTTREYFVGEVLWDKTILKLTAIVGEASIALRIISFIIFFLWASYLFPKIPILWSLIFLLNPTSIDVAMSGIRNGLAWALFMLGVMYKNKIIRYIMFVITPFFHSTSAVLLAIFYSPTKLFLGNKRTNSTIVKVKDLMMTFLPGLTIGSMLLFALPLFQYLGDRRLMLNDLYFRGGGSYTQMFFWIILIATQLRCNVEYLKKHNLIINLLVLYLMLNSLVHWSYRIWGAAIPLVAHAIWDLPRKKRQIILIMWVGYDALWWVYWTKLLWYFN